MDTIETIRPSTIYISWQSFKALDYLSKAQGVPRDQIAEQILADWIKDNHPKIVEHMKKRFEEDKKFIKLMQDHLLTPHLSKAEEAAGIQGVCAMDIIP